VECNVVNVCYDHPGHATMKDVFCPAGLRIKLPRPQCWPRCSHLARPMNATRTRIKMRLLYISVHSRVSVRGSGKEALRADDFCHPSEHTWLKSRLRSRPVGITDEKCSVDSFDGTIRRHELLSKT
jgi:hypothetical protein